MDCWRLRYLPNLICWPLFLDKVTAEILYPWVLHEVFPWSPSKGWLIANGYVADSVISHRLRNVWTLIKSHTALSAPYISSALALLTNRSCAFLHYSPLLHIHNTDKQTTQFCTVLEQSLTALRFIYTLKFYELQESLHYHRKLNFGSNWEITSQKQPYSLLVHFAAIHQEDQYRCQVLTDDCEHGAVGPALKIHKRSIYQTFSRSNAPTTRNTDPIQTNVI